MSGAPNIEQLSAWFECHRGCQGRFPLTEVIYQCPRCDNEVESDQEPERCPVCSFHGLPDGRWIMRLIS